MQWCGAWLGIDIRDIDRHSRLGTRNIGSPFLVSFEYFTTFTAGLSSTAQYLTQPQPTNNNEIRLRVYFILLHMHMHPRRRRRPRRLLLPLLPPYTRDLWVYILTYEHTHILYCSFLSIIIHCSFGEDLPSRYPVSLFSSGVDGLFSKELMKIAALYSSGIKYKVAA